MILQAFVDESGSRNQDVCMVLAGFISPAEEWIAFSDEWQACLDDAPTLEYFKMREAVKNPSGAFKNWRRDAVRAKVRDLVEIIKQHAKMAIHCTTPIRGFDVTLGDLPGPLVNPYCHNFAAIMAGIGWEAIDQKAEELELIFDEHDKYAPLIRNIYPFFKRKADPELRQVLPIEPMFRSDIKFLPLQAADMLAWLFRNAFNGRRTEWEWIATELAPVIPMSQWSTIYTRQRMNNVRKLSLEMQFTPDEVDELRRIFMVLKPKSRSTEHSAFNKAMKTILRADPTAVKEAMEREKQANAAKREAKGERKRGRKPKSLSASARASDATDD